MAAPSDPLVLGVDVGGTKVAVAGLREAAPLGLVEHPTDLASADALLAGIEAGVKEVSAELGAPVAVGLGVPSQIDFATGCVVASVNIPLEGVRLREELGARLGVPVFVDNDANCAALAEAAIADPPVRNLVMFTLGTGVGGGIVIDGRIFRGASGLGAELGHVVLEPDGPDCPGTCPNRGCFEALCSGTALGRDARELAEDRPESVLGRHLAEHGDVTAREAVEAARAGDADAQGLLERLGRYLGIGLSNAVNTFEPELIAIGGGLSRAADLFLDTALAEMRSRALPALVDRVRVATATGGVDAGVIGAALLARQEIES